MKLVLLFFLRFFSTFACYNVFNYKVKYKKIDPKFGSELINYVGGSNEINNIKILKSELESLILTRSMNISSSNTNYNNSIPNMTLNINNNANNTNTNINTTKISFDEIKKAINNDLKLDTEEKKEILNGIDEIKKIELSNAPKTEKWAKTKKILLFLLDKSVDFVITYMPQILVRLGGIFNG